MRRRARASPCCAGPRRPTSGCSRASSPSCAPRRQRSNQSLELARASLDALNLRAPVAGQLTSFSIQVGQSFNRGERLGQIDSAGRNKLRAQVDEFYLGRVAEGQIATAEVGGRPYRMRVSKIYPQVRNGAFEIDLQFIGQEPADLQRGQTVQIRLTLGDPAPALLIPNGAFYNETGGNWVFVVSPDGGSAVKRQVRLGRRNADYIEVLEGLDPGERVITSPYTGFAERDRLEPAVGNEGSRSMLSMRELSRVYRTDTVETTALDGIFLDVADGEFVAVMGPSGCGKSTLLNVIGMLDSPTSGSYVFNGTEVAGLSESKLADFRKRNIGFIFQSFNLVDELSVRENIELALLYHNVPAAERRTRVDEVMDKVGIAHRAKHRPSQLVGRPAAACRRRPGPRRQPQADPRRRADRQSRHRPWRGGDEDAPGAERRRLDHRHGHPLAEPCRLCRPRRQHARRPHPRSSTGAPPDAARRCSCSWPLVAADPRGGGRRRRGTQSTVLMSRGRGRAARSRSEWGYSDAIIAGDTIYLSGIVVGQREGESLEAAYERAYTPHRRDPAPRRRELGRCRRHHQLPHRRHRPDRRRSSPSIGATSARPSRPGPRSTSIA